LILDSFLLFYRISKDIQPVEVIADEPEPSSFSGQLLITGISLTCRLITAETQQTNLYRLIQLPSITNPSMPLPIIPILQSGPAYPGKQSLIKYFMLIPTPAMIHNEEVDDLDSFRLIHICIT
jgi:enolase